ncbi:MAG TPA: M28 family metallopeptidase [Steroidobacteraceae bacterium]|nr:M28 family metallopeptidase [Steroidobacteraceae bacterium]
MKNRTFLLLAAGLGTLALAQTATPTFTPDRFRAHVEFLADDLLEGRDTGSRGHEIAARYVATQFESFGLKPGGDDGSWFQQVTFQKTVRGRNRGQVIVAGPAGDQTFMHGENVVVVVSPRSESVDVPAQLVFVGFGVEDERLGFDDYRGLDVKGCIVVTLRGFPKGTPSEEGAHLDAIKAQIAERHGAIGLLSVDTLQSAKAQPWNLWLDYGKEPGFAWVGADGKAHQEAPGIQVFAALHGPAAEAVFAGARRKLADILAAADRPGATPRGFKLPTRVRIRGDVSWTRVTSPNVAGILPGADPKLADEYIVLSAHLDHLGLEETSGDATQDADRINNGALDNAAGVAALLEVARAAAAAPDKPRRSMLFLATTAEEKGLLGADYYARHPTVPLAQIAGNVDLDMPLLLYPFTDVIAFGANHSTIGRFVEQAARPMGIALSPDPMPEQGIFTRSDHYQFVRQGVPAVFFATGMANGGGQYWGEFLEKTYHTPRDDVSQKIDWASGARFAEVNYRVTRAMADADTPPLWYAGDYFGDVFAPNAKRAPR